MSQFSNFQRVVKPSPSIAHNTDITPILSLKVSVAVFFVEKSCRIRNSFFELMPPLVLRDHLIELYHIDQNALSVDGTCPLIDGKGMTQLLLTDLFIPYSNNIQ